MKDILVHQAGREIELWQNNCGTHFIVYQDPQNIELQQICQECNFGFVVDYDFQSCIQASILPMALYSYCKRLDRNRECDEAYSTIQIDQNELFVQENQSHDPRCAKIDTVNKICISPRFPYTLDISQNQILHFPGRYCKITNGQNCIQNYELFYISKTGNQYYGLFNFTNLNKIIQNVIYDTDIQCMQNFTLQNFKNGCIPTKFQCLKNNGVTCTCQDGEAIDSIGYTCSYFQNCLIYGYAGSQQFCIQCQSEYQNSFGQCTQQQQSLSPIQIIGDSYSSGTTTGGSPSGTTTGGSSYSTKYLEDLNCREGFQLNYVSLLSLISSVQMMNNLYYFYNYSDPIFLLLLSFAIDLAQDQSYSYYFGQGQPQQQYGCTKIINQIQGCTLQISNLCLKCQGKGLYHVQTYEKIEGEQLYKNFQSFCGQSEDLNIPNCRVIVDKKCIVCNDQYFLQQNECVKGSVPYCVAYNNYGQCILCQQQYFIRYNQCYPMIKNCLIYSVDQSIQFFNFLICGKCLNNYLEYWNAAKQVSYCIKNDYSQQYLPCMKLYSQNGCTQCSKGSFNTYVSSSTLTWCSYNYFQYFCIKFNTDSICQQCQDGYNLINGICYSSFSSMIYYQTNYFDYSCNKDSLLTDYKCQYLNKPGYYLNSQFQQNQCYLQQQGVKCNKCFKNICLDKQYSCKQGYGWSQTFKQCLPKCLNGMLQINQKQCNYRRICDKQKVSYITPYEYQCSDCSIVYNILNCQQENQCEINEIYSYKYQKCMKYCGNGLIADINSNCQSQKICQDGLDWNLQTQKCDYFQSNLDSQTYVNETAKDVNITEQQKDQNNSSYSFNNNSNQSFTMKQYLIIIFTSLSILLILVIIITFIIAYQKIQIKMHQNQKQQKTTKDHLKSQLNKIKLAKNSVKKINKSIQANKDDIDEIREQSIDLQTIHQIDNNKNQEIGQQSQNQ